MEKYPKFKNKKECAFPEREICNYSESDNSIQRCPYMKYDNSKSIFDSTRWRCIYKKEEKQSNNDNNHEVLKEEKS